MDTTNMKNLIIVGASGFGREVAQYIEDINSSKSSPVWNILGFIDDNLNALDGIGHGYKVIDTIKDHVPLKDAGYVCALAFPKTKEKIIDLLSTKGAEFVTIIHPTARVSRYAKIGKGCILTPNSNVNTDAEIGDFVAVLASGIGHDAKVGNFTTLSGHVCVNGHVEIGDSVYVGCGALIAPGKKIGNAATVGIGSVVVTNVKPGITVFGNPAKKLI